jgi:hypothetical protein
MKEWRELFRIGMVWNGMEVSGKGWFGGKWYEVNIR